MFYAEKQAKEFLEKYGFDVLTSIYIKNPNKLKGLRGVLDFPVAVKVFGKNIVHKKKLGGVTLNVKSIKEIIKIFKKMKKIKGFEGIVIQEMTHGKEILLGVKKTPEFDHVIAFGAGGSNVEKLKDVSFRVVPFSKKDALEMIDETKISRDLNKNEKNLILKNIFLLQEVLKKYPSISELDINPLSLVDGVAKVIDARIVFEE